MLLAIAVMALALLSAATLAPAIRALLAAARVAQITAAAVSSIEIGAAIAIVVGAFRIPTRIAVEPPVRAVALLAACCVPNCVCAAMMMRL